MVNIMSHKKFLIIIISAAAVVLSCAIYARFPIVESESELSTAEKSAVRAVALEYNRKFSFPVKISVTKREEDGKVILFAHAEYAFGRAGFNYILVDSGNGFENTGEMESDPVNNPFGW